MSARLHRIFWVIGFAAVTTAAQATLAHASTIPAQKVAPAPIAKTAKPAVKTGVKASMKPRQLTERLSEIRSEVMSIEQQLVDGSRAQKAARMNIVKIKTLLKLQKEEQGLQKQRIAELEGTVRELEVRRGSLKEKVGVQQTQIRASLREIERSMREQPKTLHLPERERLEAPRRRVLAGLVDRGVKEIETLKADLADADLLEAKIQEEKQHLTYLAQDLKEQEGVLALNQQIQGDLIRKKHADRLGQLDDYRKLKGSEVQVEQLLKDFNARIELEKAVETEKVASRAMMQGEFGRMKGRLSLPVSGKIVTAFGRTFDQKTSLYIFKKGIDIATDKGQSVSAISPGKIAYSGELPNYGRIAIIDHGDHFYSLCAHLGELRRKTGEVVAAGDVIGSADDEGTPVYFEIRARNVAVNPLQWLAN